MSERLQKLRNRISDGQSEWYRLVGNPYVRAYDTAFYSYKEQVDNQAAAEKERAEMFVMAASIVTGSVLMAAFANSSLRVLAGRAVLSAVCNRNLNLVFNAMHAVSSSKAFMFALGKVLDEGKSRATKVAQDAMTKVVQSNSKHHGQYAAGPGHPHRRLSALPDEVRERRGGSRRVEPASVRGGEERAVRDPRGRTDLQPAAWRCQ